MYGADKTAPFWTPENVSESTSFNNSIQMWNKVSMQIILILLKIRFLKSRGHWKKIN